MFDGSNQNASDLSSVRSILYRDLKNIPNDNIFDHKKRELKATLLFPVPGSDQTFALGSTIPVFGELNLDENEISRVEFYINGEEVYTQTLADRKSGKPQYTFYSLKTSSRVNYNEETGIAENDPNGDFFSGFTPTEEGNYSVSFVAFPSDDSKPSYSDVAKFQIKKNEASQIPGLILKSPIENEFFTSSSKIVLLGNGWDIDGDYKWTDFYVNGANELIQFKQNPREDEIFIKINDTNISFVQKETLEKTIDAIIGEIKSKEALNFINARAFRGNTILMNVSRTDLFDIDIEQEINGEKIKIPNDNSPVLDYDKILVKAQILQRVYRPTGESPQTFPFTRTWTPFLPGAYMFHASGSDSSNNVVLSSQKLVTATFGSNGPSAKLTAPNELAKFTGQLTLTSAGEVPKEEHYLDPEYQGLGYETRPKVSVVGDGVGSKAVAIMSDYGSIEKIIVTDKGHGYTFADFLISPTVGSLLDGSAPIVYPVFSTVVTESQKTPIERTVTVPNPGFNPNIDVSPQNPRTINVPMPVYIPGTTVQANTYSIERKRL